MLNFLLFYLIAKEYQQKIAVETQLNCIAYTLVRWVLFYLKMRKSIMYSEAMKSKTGMSQKEAENAAQHHNVRKL